MSAWLSVRPDVFNKISDGFFIRDNIRLANLDALFYFYMWGDDDYNECEFRIENNQVLYAYSLKNNPYKKTYLDVRTSGNFRECGNWHWYFFSQLFPSGCRGDDLFTSSLDSYKTCEFLFGGLHFSSTPDSSILSALSRIRTVKGRFIIENTDLKDLSFFGIFYRFEIKNVGLKDEAFINIRNNTKMTGLGMNSFRSNGVTYSTEAWNLIFLVRNSNMIGRTIDS